MSLFLKPIKNYDESSPKHLLAIFTLQIMIKLRKTDLLSRYPEQICRVWNQYVSDLKLISNPFYLKSENPLFPPSYIMDRTFYVTYFPRFPRSNPNKSFKLHNLLTTSRASHAGECQGFESFLNVTMSNDRDLSLIFRSVRGRDPN